MDYEDRTAEVVKKVVLEKLRFGAQAVMGCNWVNDVQLKAYTDVVADNLVIALTAHVVGQQLKVAAIKAPATWWDAVKERFFPRWLRRLMPVEYRLEVITAYALYPEIALPDSKHLLYHRVEIKRFFEPPVEGLVDDVE